MDYIDKMLQIQVFIYKATHNKHVFSNAVLACTDRQVKATDFFLHPPVTAGTKNTFLDSLV